MNRWNRALWAPGWILFAALLALDLWSKHWISGNFAKGQTRPIVDGFLNLTLVHNTGAAFGIGAQWAMPVFITTTLIAMGVILYMFAKLEEHERLTRWALVFILAGAMGNFVDRARTGYVVDFLDVYFRTHHWWTFNIADSCITVGAALFGIDMFRKRKRSEPGEGETS
jgi:signal peptidase II